MKIRNNKAFEVTGDFKVHWTGTKLFQFKLAIDVAWGSIGEHCGWIADDAEVTEEFVNGGEFHGGEFLSGVFHGGEFHDGEFHGGEFHGGEFRGGEFRGGEFLGGEFHTSPLFVQGTRHFVCLVGDVLNIGCNQHSVEYWLQSFEQIGHSNCYSEEQIQEYKNYIELAAKILEAQTAKA